MLLYRFFRLRKYGEPLPVPEKESQQSESPILETEPLEEAPQAVITVTREKPRKRDKKRVKNADLGVVIEEEESVADSMDLSRVIQPLEEIIAEAMVEAAVYE